MNIYIPWTWFATQWPCPDGFHVPLISERNWLKTIMDWLSLTWESWRTKLHIPYCWMINYDGRLFRQWQEGYYWSSSALSWQNASTYYIVDSYVWSYSTARWQGVPIRCFKDSFVAPTSGWTVVQWTLGSAWIFWNQTDWLISITSNWTTGYTIQDKNLWATTVYNWWDTLTQANMWKMYQRWNNYWFPSTWGVSVSSTLVNASTYWPWNYYESSTFTCWYNPFIWDSSYNDNLRWWLDWNVPVTTMKEVKNIYIC